MDTLHLWLIAALLLSILAALILLRLWQSARRKLTAAVSSQRSLSTKYGQMTEQFMPFLPNYPWDPQRFRFIGSPIDGVQFEDDRVILVEFKTGTSRLTQVQRRVRNLVREGRVEFEELRIG